MTWSPVKSPIPDLLALYARAQRLRVIDKIKAAEIQMRAAGLDPTPFMNVRRALLDKAIGDFERPEGRKLKTPQAPPDRSKPLRHLAIQDGSDV